jgi:hypothetical protein
MLEPRETVMNSWMAETMAERMLQGPEIKMVAPNSDDTALIDSHQTKTLSFSLRAPQRLLLETLTRIS